MKEEQEKKIEAIYEQLLGTNHGLGTPDSSQTTTEGPLRQVLLAIDELEGLTSEDLKHFLPNYWTHEYDSKREARTTDIKAQLNGLLGWLRASHLTAKQPHYAQAVTPLTSVNQVVNQDVDVMQSVTLDINEILTKKESDYEEGTAERSFLDKVKIGLKGVKDAAALVSLILQVAQQCGLTTHQLQQIFT